MEEIFNQILASHTFFYKLKQSIRKESKKKKRNHFTHRMLHLFCKAVCFYILNVFWRWIKPSRTILALTTSFLRTEMSSKHGYMPLNGTVKIFKFKRIFFSFLIFFQTFLDNFCISKHFLSIIHAVQMLLDLCIANMKSSRFITWKITCHFLDENFNIESSIRMKPLRVWEVIHGF